jgi:predicted kinase
MTSNGVLVLTGPPCAGKSSVANLLGTSDNHRVKVEVDSLFDLLLPGSDRNRADRMLAYDAAHFVARTILESGRTAVLECTYARREQRASLLAAIAGSPVPRLWVVEFFVTADDAVERFRGRDQATDLTEELVRERVEAFPYSELALRVDSVAKAPAEIASEIMTWIRQAPRPVPGEEWVAAGIEWD